MPCDVEDIASVDAVFAEIEKQWGGWTSTSTPSDSGQERIEGALRRDIAGEFQPHHGDSCFSFTESAKRAAEADAERRRDADPDVQRRRAHDAELQRDGTCQGRARSLGALSAVDFGPYRIRVNAISAGPIRTLAAPDGDARAMFAFQQRHSPLGRGVTLEELGGAALYLLSGLSTGTTAKSISSIAATT